MTYLSLEAELHDVFWSEEGPAAELPLLEDFLKKYPGPSLELGCGSGRLLFPLIEKGYTIEGLDLSPDMLRFARKSATEQNLSPTLHEASIDDFSLNKVYDSILVPAFTLQLSKDPVKALGIIRKHLTQGGGLYITTFIPWSEIVAETPADEWYDDNGHAFKDGRSAICRTKMQIDRIAQTLTRDHHYRLFDKKDKLITEHHSTQNLTWFWQQEMQLMLEANGFRLDQVLQDFSYEKPEDDVPHVLTFLATSI